MGWGMEKADIGFILNFYFKYTLQYKREVDETFGELVGFLNWRGKYNITVIAVFEQCNCQLFESTTLAKNL